MAQRRAAIPAASGTIDVEAKAYEDIKNIWIKEKIWNPKWGQLPGMTWMPDPERPKTTEGLKELNRLFGLLSGVARENEHERPFPSPQNVPQNQCMVSRTIARTTALQQLLIMLSYLRE